MVKKIIVIVLALSVLGATAAAFVYQVGAQGDTQTSQDVLTDVQGNSANQLGNTLEAGSQLGLSEPWQATGRITEIDDNGMTLLLENGESAYVELGPQDYWTTQGVDLQVGQTVDVTGTIADEMIHANEVQLPDDQVLLLRTDEGKPLWSGGADNSGGGLTDGDHVPQPQASVDEWVTVSGTLMAFQGGNMTMSTPDGEIISFQSGQPRFFASQGVNFQVGDEISVLGYYNGDRFVAGEIVQVSTGLRVMLRDPNGRPLWAGPGNESGSGNGNGNGNGGGNGGFKGGGNNGSY